MKEYFKRRLLNNLALIFCLSVAIEPKSFYSTAIRLVIALALILISGYINKSLPSKENVINILMDILKEIRSLPRYLLINVFRIITIILGFFGLTPWINGSSPSWLLIALAIISFVIHCVINTYVREKC